MAFEDIVIVDLDVQKTTWSRVHSAMRTLYLKLNRDPDIAWSKFFFEERNSRVELKRHGLWIEDGYIVFDCLLIDVDNHHLPDIRQSITYANDRSRELVETQREERERNKAKARDEAEMLKSLRANIRDDRDRALPESATEPAASMQAESAPEPETAQSLEEAAHAQLEKGKPQAAAQTAADAPVSNHEQRLRDFYDAMAPKGAAKAPPSEPGEPARAAEETTAAAAPEEPEAPTAPEAESAVAESAPADTASIEPAPAETEPAETEPATPEPEPEPQPASEFDLQSKRNDWRARFRAAFERNKN
jgi:hypothetical protein